jgi:RNA polymerase sigma-70 factor (ECF subfamily)
VGCVEGRQPVPHSGTRGSKRARAPYGGAELELWLAEMSDSKSKFQTTSWSLVVAAAANPTGESAKALGDLCSNYWRPVYTFVRRSGYDPDQAQDLTQGFFAVLLEKHYLRDADRSRGRFRSFLLTAVKHFLANEWDRANALKRGGGEHPISIDAVEAEAWCQHIAVKQSTPESLFERHWAESLLDQVFLFSTLSRE